MHPRGDVERVKRCQALVVLGIRHAEIGHQVIQLRVAHICAI